jgi:hypothetical protein
VIPPRRARRRGRGGRPGLWARAVQPLGLRPPCNFSKVSVRAIVAAARATGAERARHELGRGRAASCAKKGLLYNGTWVKAVTVLTLTAGRRCGAVRCGRRRSSDQDDRRVGLSPGARNTTESARKEGERNPDFLAFSGFGWTVRLASERPLCCSSLGFLLQVLRLWLG